MSTVIKKGEQGKLLQRLVSFDMADHMAEARSIVAAAKAQAQQLVGEARIESRRLKEEAGRQGHAEGYQAGHAEGVIDGREQGLAQATERFNGEHAALAAAMAAAIEALEAQKQNLLIEAERDLLEFATALAQKVTHCVARLDRQAAVANVEQALRLVANKTDLTIQVSPLDADTMRRFAEDVTERLGEVEHVRVVEDESVSPGGAVVTSEGQGRSEVDARIETQLDQIVSLLLGVETEESGSSPAEVTE